MGAIPDLFTTDPDDDSVSQLDRVELRLKQLERTALVILLGIALLIYLAWR